MAINKIIYGGETLIDLTSDTITASDLASGKTAHDKTGKIITGTNTYDSDTSEDTADAAEVLYGKTAHVRGKLVTGTMPNRGAVSGMISSKDGTYTVPNGFHDGSGSVGIDATEKAKLVAANIRKGITILGIEGSMSGDEDVKAQSKTVTPTTKQQTVTPDMDYNYLSQVVVAAIPYVETDNAAGGKTATIG